jgi:hypothetical protein
VNTALQRAVELLADPPSNPDVSKGYLDLLGSVPATDALGVDISEPMLARAVRAEAGPQVGAYFFTEDEIGDILEDLGLVGVRTKSFGTIQWVRGKRP